MAPRTRRNRSHSRFGLGIGAAALSGLTLPGWKLPVGGMGQAAGYGGQLRIEVGFVDPDPFQYRAHPASAKVRWRRPGGVVEVGIVPLAGAAAVLLAAALSIGFDPVNWHIPPGPLFIEFQSYLLLVLLCAVTLLAWAVAGGAVASMV